MMRTIAFAALLGAALAVPAALKLASSTTDFCMLSKGTGAGMTASCDISFGTASIGGNAQAISTLSGRVTTLETTVGRLVKALDENADDLSAHGLIDVKQIELTPGADGATGHTGNTGADGATGHTGNTGADGATGHKGDDGDDGAAGATGHTGNDGATGHKGDNGDDGAAGATGAPGADAPTPPPSPPTTTAPPSLPMSCNEALSRGLLTTTGLITLRTSTGATYRTFCDQSDKGGGWTLAAVVASGGSAWQYGDDEKNAGDMDSPWESWSTFNTGDSALSAQNADLKTGAYAWLAKSEIMIKYNGNFLLQSGTCHSDLSLMETFNGLHFSADSSDPSWKTQAEAQHTCSIVDRTTRSGDVLLDGENANTLYLKWGEQEGAEDGNKDRTYISTTGRGTGSNRLDYNNGLGSFVSFSGSEHTVNVGQQHDGAVSVGSGHFYEIYVRAAVRAIEANEQTNQASCEALKSQGITASGVYTLTGGQAYCDMSTDGGGWTQAATVTSSGVAWQYGDSNGNQGDLNSNWESSSTFGSAGDLVNDFKGWAYNSMPKSKIMITMNGQFLLAASGCHSGKSMKQTFNDLQFSADSGDSNWKTQPENQHICQIYDSRAVSGDTLNDGETPSQLYLKYGEQEGAEDGNKDRTYISTTARGTGSNRLDYNNGLGSFVSFSGSEHTVNVGQQHDGAVSVAGGRNYVIWVK